MQTALSIFLVLVGLFFCVGLISPKVFHQGLTRGRVFVLSMVLFIVFGFVSAQLPDEPKVEGPKIEAVEIKPEEIAFDIPSFVKSKTIEDVKKVLGTPTHDTEPTGLQVNAGVDEWEKTYAAKSGQQLLVTYHPKTRAIVDYFLPLNTTSTTVLLKLGNLNPEANEYRLEPVQALSLPLGNYTGMKVTPRR
jgi:hypothetical protein